MLGLLTLGHSPRGDLEAPFRKLLPSIPITTRGALDEVSEDELTSLLTIPGTYPLHVITRSGPLSIQRDALLGGLSYQGDQLVKAGAKLIVLLCAGDFPSIPSTAPVLLPGHLLEGAARSVARNGKLGVIVPSVYQQNSAQRRWRLAGFEPIVFQAEHGTEQLIVALRQAAVEQVVLDCISFSTLLQEELVSELHIPVWLPMGLVAGAITSSSLLL